MKKLRAAQEPEDLFVHADFAEDNSDVNRAGELRCQGNMALALRYAATLDLGGPRRTITVGDKKARCELKCIRETASTTEVRVVVFGFNVYWSVMRLPYKPGYLVRKGRDAYQGMVAELTALRARAVAHPSWKDFGLRLDRTEFALKILSGVSLLADAANWRTD